MDLQRLRIKTLLSKIENEQSRASNYIKEYEKSKQALAYTNRFSDHSKPPKLQNFNKIEEINTQITINPTQGTLLSKRTGVLGYKMGMTGTWDQFGTWFPLTVVKVDNCQVLQIKTNEKDKYCALQLGVGYVRDEKVKRPMLGHFTKANCPSKKDVREFKVSEDNILPVGYMLNVRHFVPGQYIDIIGTTKGKGWQGVQKRWNFAGGFATHGCSLKHRAAVIKYNKFRDLLVIESFQEKFGKGKEWLDNLEMRKRLICILLSIRLTTKIL